jgi:hypothetical protein
VRHNKMGASLPVIFDRSSRFGLAADVRFAPKATRACGGDSRSPPPLNERSRGGEKETANGPSLTPSAPYQGREYHG